MNNFKRSVFCTLQFEAYHRCPAEICENTNEYYLQYTHRHIFHVRCEAPVEHNNRAIEFINLKQKISNFCIMQYGHLNIHTTSCEMIAEAILNKFPELQKVEVSEDGENGAIVQRNDCEYVKQAHKHEDDLR